LVAIEDRQAIKSIFIIIIFFGGSGDPSAGTPTTGVPDRRGRAHLWSCGSGRGGRVWSYHGNFIVVFLFTVREFANIPTAVSFVEWLKRRTKREINLFIRIETQ